MQMLLGNSIFWYDSLDSTQDLATEAWRQGKIRSGDIIISYEQLQGRGMRQNKWYSEAGQNLTFSFPLSFASKHQLHFFGLITFVSLALHAFIRDTTKREKVYIKWVNDLILENRKLSGILIDAVWQKNHLACAIIGIGVNVNQLDFADLERATSLQKVTGKSYNLPVLLASLINYLNHFAELLLAGSEAELHDLYNKYLFRRLDWLGAEQIIGVTETGLLATLDKQGQRRFHNFPYHQIDFYANC